MKEIFLKTLKKDIEKLIKVKAKMDATVRTVTAMMIATVTMNMALVNVDIITIN
jgi:hypothetical protein